jgi:elongator complex protein 1
VESTIHPGLEDAQQDLTDVFDEMRGQLDKEMKRIAELRKILQDDPGICLFYARRKRC